MEAAIIHCIFYVVFLHAYLYNDSIRVMIQMLVIECSESLNSKNSNDLTYN